MPFEPELGHGALELVGGFFRRLHRQRRNPHETFRMRGDVLGDLVVLDRRRRHADGGLLIVEISLRRGREHVHVDAACIHVAQAARDIETSGRERPVGDARHIERGVFRIDRRDGHRHPRFGEQRGGFLGEDMAMGIDGALAHFVP